MTARASVQVNDPMAFALPLIDMACRLAGPTNFIEEGRAALSRQAVIGAVRRHDTATLFDWLMTVLSFQGIADRLAKQYLRDHGNVSWADIQRDLRRKPGCVKLRGFWAFDGCRYEKGAFTCAEPDQIGRCPLPAHDLRNGRLNQTAYSLFFFIRDIAAGDLVQWIDRRIAAAGSSPGDLAAVRWALVEPLRGVYGISDKVISMALSQLMLAIGSRRPAWFEVGASFVVVDTLVHNFLHRTGILERFDANHLYGAACYQPNGCADLIDRFARRLDASTFNPTFPKVFPRFVQVAIWRYCSENGLDICNGNQIDDRDRCDNVYCQLRQRCARVALPKVVKRQQKQALDSFA